MKIKKFNEKLDTSYDIKLSYNDDEMMSIKDSNGKTIFYGNYWDFDNSPNGIKKFLELLNFNVDIKKDLEY